MFNKKFKIRVKYFAEGKYCVQYAYYYIIPIYRSLLFWFEGAVTSSVHCWSTRLMNIKDAEELAKTLKSMDDVNMWYEKDVKKRKEFYERRKAYYANNVPYNTKKF